MLEQALALAVAAHRGQRNRAGVPYILHPLRVMLKLATCEERAVAVLHDVVEDTDVTLDALAQAFPGRVVAAVDALTRRTGEAYDAYIGRVTGDALARRVKLADLEDNSDPAHLVDLRPKDHERLARYAAAHARLGAGR